MELVDGELEWHDGYRGFVQLIVLTARIDVRKRGH